MPLYCCEHRNQRIIIYYFDCRSSDDQEVLFDQILMGQLEFPLPYWDNVSETAKVNTDVFMDTFWSETHCFLRGIKTDCCLFPAQGADPIHAGGGGGSEVHCPPGVGAPLGHCKYSISGILAANKLEYFTMSSVFLNPFALLP